MIGEYILHSTLALYSSNICSPTAHPTLPISIQLICLHDKKGVEGLNTTLLVIFISDITLQNLHYLGQLENNICVLFIFLILVNIMKGPSIFAVLLTYLHYI